MNEPELLGIIRVKCSQTWVEYGGNRYKVHISEVSRVAGDNLNLEHLHGELVYFEVDDNIVPPNGSDQWVKNGSLMARKDIDGEA